MANTLLHLASQSVHDHSVALVIGDKIVYGWVEEDTRNSYRFNVTGGRDVIKTALTECLTYTRHTDMGTVEELPMFAETEYQGEITLIATVPQYDNW